MNILLNTLPLVSQTVIDRLQGLSATEDKSIAQQQLADPDYWGSVGIITLTGILVVFLILAILIAFFYLIGAIFKSVDKAKARKAEAAREAAAAEKKETLAAEPAPVIEAVEEAQSDEELIAVISAAIAAYGEAEGFTIKSVRRRGERDGRTRSAWSAAGISENTRPF